MLIRDIIDRTREYRKYQKSPYADKNKTSSSVEELVLYHCKSSIITF